jgi:hypothetical protein
MNDQALAVRPLKRRHFSGALAALPWLASAALSPLSAQAASAAVGQAAPDFSAVDTAGKRIA